MFEWTEEHQLVEKMMRSFFEKELVPLVDDMEEGKVLPYPVIRKLLETFGMTEAIRQGLQAKANRLRQSAEGGTSEDAGFVLAGGAGQDPAMTALLAKEASRISPGFFLSFGAQLGLCGMTLVTKGNADQLERFAIPVMTMEKVGAWGLTEPNSGSDAFALETIAEERGDHFVLNGSKAFITNAPYADIMVVYAKVAGARADKSRVYPFVVERGMQGLTTGAPMKKMGMKASPTGEIFLDDVMVPRENLLGSLESSSREQAKGILEGERTGAPAMCLGIIERCITDATRYAIQRKQFGKSIADFQLVQARIAKMYVHCENVRNLVFKQIWMQKKRKGTMRDACAGKYYCSEAAVEVALEAVQLMGGNGYMQEFAVERLMRDAELLRIGGGTSDIQLLNIAKDLLGKEGHEVSLGGR
jgi:acyl-CoA dehydrogenase